MNSRNQTFEVYADFREDISMIGNILTEKYGINVVRRHLKVGDFIIDDRIVIERKTSYDFVQSLIDDRLFRQAQQMKKAYDDCILVIEGDNINDTPINCHPHAIQGALVSLSLSWQVPVLFSKNNNQTAFLIWLMINQNIPPYRDLSSRHGRRPKRLYKRQLYILHGLPHVGAKLAVRLLRHFGSVECIMAAPVKQLTAVKGLGKKKAHMIRDIIVRKV